MRPKNTKFRPSATDASGGHVTRTRANGRNCPSGAGEDVSLSTTLSLSPELLTVREVADLIRLTPKGVYSMVAQQRIPCVKFSNRVRFVRADVVAWLNENRVPSLEYKR